MRRIDLTGDRFGRLVALHRDYGNPRKWFCLCDCGEMKSFDRGNLRSGATRSCGCLSAELALDRCRTHGLSKTKEHRLWAYMRARSRGQGSHGHYYQELGVTVCDRWLEPHGAGFENFLEDMGKCPDGMTLDRVDNRKGYSKDNCAWADMSQQCSNRRKGRDNTSGRIGVRWANDREKWRVSLRVQGVLHNLGQFDSYSEACEVCEEAEWRLLGYSRGEY